MLVKEYATLLLGRPRSEDEEPQIYVELLVNAIKETFGRVDATVLLKRALFKYYNDEGTPKLYLRNRNVVMDLDAWLLSIQACIDNEHFKIEKDEEEGDV